VSFAYHGDEGTLVEPEAGEATPESPVVLRHLTFNLAPGQTLGLAGRTGAGKSTIANLLFRSYDAGSGEVRVAGRDIRDIRLTSLRERIGLVTQDVHIFSATLRDNLTFFDSAVEDARLIAVLERLGLVDWLARLPGGLDATISAESVSAGEAQLIAFARVFLKEPGLLILDEPSSRLDAATEALLERAVDVLLEGRTAIIIAHRLSTMRRADEVLVIDDGEVLERGGTTHLLDDPESRFAALHRAGELTP
jgi:ATP-binding cassette subfamily B protein/ATP-binding cassette subfamily C protein